MRDAISVLACLLVITSSASAGAAEADMEVGMAIKFQKGASAYVVATPKTEIEKRIVGRLMSYLSEVLGRPARTVGSLSDVPGDEPAVVLEGNGIRSPLTLKIPSGSREAFALATGKVGNREIAAAAGASELGLKRAVQRLIIASEQRTDGLAIPNLSLSEKPWIPNREWTFCPWEPSTVRGVFYNPYADKRLNVYLYSQDMLADYVEMFDWFGFSGGQLTETSYSYEVFGSVEAFHEWQKTVARLLKENGQDVTLWAWAAEFTMGGWRDPDAVYKPESGKTAFEDEQVRRTFEKYYGGYADLAPYADRFIAHFYDPGRLTDRTDVLNYTLLLKKKLKAKNPDIEMGIDCWSATPDFLMEMSKNGLDDYLMLLLTFPGGFSAETRQAFHEQAKKLGLKLGMWGWYTTEYETDQLASMYVNAELLKNVYTGMRKGPLKIHPVVYWSEMEAHHLNNIYSMYVSSQLLWNPDRDPGEALAELTECIWGPRNGPEVLRALELIQDVRTGPKWDTYWWTAKEYRIGTDDPSEDLRRAEECLKKLREMKPDETFVSKFPTPYPPETLVELMIPHLEQIRLYAEFRLKVEDIHNAAKSGASRETLEKMLTDAWKPIPEFGTWTGTFGGPELRRQKKTVLELRKAYGLSASDPAWLVKMECDRILQRFQIRQMASAEPFTETAALTNEFYWPEEFMAARMEKLVSDGLLEKAGNDRYRLTDWRNWAATGRKKGP